jgi:hypothetical protein
LLTSAEWRAKQLADALAKRGASSSELRINADRLIKQAGDALLQSAAKLGVVTLAANSHSVVSVRPDGTSVNTTYRDSTKLPIAVAKARAARREQAAVKPAQPVAQPATTRLATPLVPMTLAQERSLRKRKMVAERQADETRRGHDALQAIVATATPPLISAAERMAALRRRLGI